MKRFELEENIMNLWSDIDQMDLYLESWDGLTEDQQINVLIGHRELLRMRIETVFKSFEECVRENQL